MYQSIEQFLEHLRLKRYAKVSITSYRDGLKLFVRYLESRGILTPQAITLDILNDYKEHLENDAKNYSRNTIHLRLRTIKKLFEYLEATHQLLINPCEKLILPRLDRHLPKNILTQDEMKKLLATPNTSIRRGIRDRALLETLYSTGIRLRECLNLNVYDVDYETGHLRVTKGKGSKDRIVALGKESCQWLKEYLEQVRPYLMREKKISRINKREVKHKKKILSDDERALWVSQFGKRVTAIWINRLLNIYAQEAGLKKPVSVHTFRRSFATHMLAEGANLYYVQQLMGHAHARTLSHYVRLAPREAKDAHKRHHPREKEGRRWKRPAINITKYS